MNRKMFESMAYWRGSCMTESNLVMVKHAYCAILEFLK